MDGQVGEQGGEADPDRRDAGAAPEPGPAPRAAGRANLDLRSAIRAARIDDAERSRAIADLRGAEIARLELLQEAIGPVLAQVPEGIEMFDAGLIPVPSPRLFIDMIAFVEMAHDKRHYRLVQETRQGRLLLAQSERLEVMQDAVTSYVARRLIEREKALAGPAAVAPRPSHGDPHRRGRPVRFAWLRTPAAVVLNYLGIAALSVLAWVIGRAIYQSWPAPWFR